MIMNPSNSWTLLILSMVQDAGFVTDIMFGVLVTGRKYGKLK